MTRTLRACGPCKRRKVRCNGEQTCQQCTHLGLRCHYAEADPAARSRKRVSRGAVIKEHRGPSSAAPRSVAPQLAITVHDSPSRKPSPIEYHLVFDAEYFAPLLNDYSDCVFPFLPIIPGAQFRSLVSKAEFNREDAALVHALTAVTINMTRVRSWHRNNEPDQIKILYTRALELRGMIMPESPITIENTMIPLLVSICLFAKRSNIKMGFYFLREAIARLQLLEDSELLAPGNLSAEKKAQIERLHWLLFVHERFVSVTYNRNVVLPALRTLPTRGPTIEDLTTEGFNYIIALFSVIDVVFIEHWLDRQSASLTIAWIDKKQLEIGRDMDVWESEIRHLTEMQQVDLIVTRYWLHMLLWQMALSKFLLTSGTEEDFMSIIFPIRLSRRLRSILVSIQPEAIELHGTGIVQKVFEITNTIADIIIHIPTATITGESPKDHLDDFLFLYSFLLRMSEFHPVEEAVLEDKLRTIQSKLPGD